MPLTISGLATKEDTDGVMERLETFFGSKQQFHDKYEAVLMDMIQCAFLRNEAECTQGYLLTDEEVEAACGAWATCGTWTRPSWKSASTTPPP